MNNIYTPLDKPTRLYIKKLNNLYYFGKTVKSDVHNYTGSGLRWTNHFKKYGKQNIETLWVSGWYYDTSIVDAAIHFSNENNIANSPLWANIIPENGINGGGDCSQMHNEETWLKAKNTSNNKTQEEKDKIIERARKSIFERYGLEKHGQIMTNENSIAKRNNTNLLRHGCICAANKNGNKKSLETRHKKYNRLVVKKIKCLAYLKKYKLTGIWWCNSDTELNNLFLEIIKIQPKEISKNYNNSQTKRDKFLKRKDVIILMTINRICSLNLSQNWFQKDDIHIKNILDIVKKNHPEEFYIVLQLIDQYCLEFHQL